MTPQEQVKMLRQRLEFARGCYTAMGGCAPSALDSIDEALAATAPPLRFYMPNVDACVYDRDQPHSGNGTGHYCVGNLQGATEPQRAAVLDALNALAEKENAR